MQVSKKKFISVPLIFSLSLLGLSGAYAAIPVDLSHQNIQMLPAFTMPATGAISGGATEINRNIDFNQTLHVRIQQTYAGFPIFGADAIVHIPHGEQTPKGIVQITAAAKANNGTMDGTFYQSLSSDLGPVSGIFLSSTQMQKAEQSAINDFYNRVGGKSSTKNQQTKLIVYVDDKNKAHWAYEIRFQAMPLKANQLPAKPVYIIDASTFEVYLHWDEIKTLDELKLKNANGGGFGGNIKMGKLTYDGLSGNLPVLMIQRNAKMDLCYLQNKDVKVNRCIDSSPWGGCYESVAFTVPCESMNANHNNVYWNGELDAVNGGYSPSNDALFNGTVIKDMYQNWYNTPVLVENGRPMKLRMVVHLKMDNAFWDGRAMNFGDGETLFYPLTSLGVSAHEISHGFTEQHSNLNYTGQSGGMNEAYSDMAAQAAEFYAYGKNSWQIGPEIFKEENEALRYMDQPSKDCHGNKPGNDCSIDNASEYYKGLNVHYSSGVYNRFFYLLGTTPGWDTRKAFDVMEQANSSYWTPNTNFERGACGVIKATKDYHYNIEDVVAAFTMVGVNTSKC